MSETFDIKNVTGAIVFTVGLSLRTSLMLKSGGEGIFTDSTIERTPDGQLHVNGYVWAGLLRRALGRLAKGASLAARIGKYDGDEKRLSPLWCEATFVKEDVLERYINGVTGIRINRRWGANETGALYSDEIVNPGLSLVLSFTWLCREEDPQDVINQFREAFWVVNEGVETIGGGWSYGYGRLDVKQFRAEKLDLTDSAKRNLLWQPSDPDRISWLEDEVWRNPSQDNKPAVVRPWHSHTISATIANGQLMAIHTTMPPVAPVSDYDKYPDTFALHRTVLTNKGKPITEYLVTGKAFRQAILSTAIERKLRTGGEDICLDTTADREKDRKNSPEKRVRCQNGRCRRCLWFGDTDAGGIVSIADAVVKNAVTTVVNRVQLCEHSLQNMNLFSGEYLVRGDFNFDMIVDMARPDSEPDVLLREIDTVLKELTPLPDVPPGWHRLGATATCTGQIEIKPNIGGAGDSK